MTEKITAYECPYDRCIAYRKNRIKELENKNGQ